MTTLAASPRTIQVLAPVIAPRTANATARPGFWLTLLRALSAAAA